MMLFDDSENIPVATDPAGAEALVDGFPHGRTPTVIHLDKKSSHVVTFRKEGYQDSSVTVDRRLDVGHVDAIGQRQRRGVDRGAAGDE